MTFATIPAPAPLRAKDALSTRWHTVRTLLVLQGVPQNRALTEAARMGTLEVWEMVNGWRRRERAIGSMTTAHTLDAALRPLQDIVVQLLRRPGDPVAAGETVRTARQAFEAEGVQGSVGAEDARAAAAVGEVFRSLEDLLCRSSAQAA